MKRPYRAYLFDMDGTVLNTLTDLTLSLNKALVTFGRRGDYTEAQVRLFFGSGIAVAIRRALLFEQGVPIEKLVLVGTDREKEIVRPGMVDPDLEEKIRTFYKPWYEEHCNDHTAPYAGIPELLHRMKGQGILTAVVSNKPDGAVEKLADDLFPGCFDYTAGEKDGIRRKPAPDMLEAALKYLNVAKEDAVYIGDSEVDLETAKNTGLPCISVLWGFRDRDFLISHGATTFAEKAEDILPWKEHA